LGAITNYQPYAMELHTLFHPRQQPLHPLPALRARLRRAGGQLYSASKSAAPAAVGGRLGTPLGRALRFLRHCLQVCPTGALIDRQSAYRGREVQVEYQPTIASVAAWAAA